MAIFCVDFDGTMVAHDYPKIGGDIGAVPILRLIAKRNQIILYTMRTGVELSEAVKWCQDNAIPLWGINENPNQKTWSSSPKVFGNIYIDDAALGCPLKIDSAISDRPFVDWGAVYQSLAEQGRI
ncbi:polynucleotide kinase/nucleotidase 5'-nucleotidase containing HAD domain [Aeromonas phage Gekk3-15]